MKVKIDNKEITSPKTLANKFSEAVMKKIERIREDTPEKNIIAKKVFRDVVPRIEEDFKL